MRVSSIIPGSIWDARPLSPELLNQQWEAEILHASANVNLSELAFNDDDWDSWRWNAKEALHLNGQRGILRNLPVFMDKLQLKINFHLLHAFQTMISGWREWENLPYVNATQEELNRPNLSFLLVSALGRLEQAQVKQDSLESQKYKGFQIFSMRQHRLFQQLSALLLDLNPIVSKYMEYSDNEDERRGICRIHEDIKWHAKELTRLVGGFDQKPSFVERINTPKREINRLLGTACHFHAEYLAALLNQKKK